jgi:hypothetical protein
MILSLQSASYERPASKKYEKKKKNPEVMNDNKGMGREVLGLVCSVITYPICGS